MKRIASGMKTLGMELDLILSSPYVRAHQTAEIAAEALNLSKKLKFSDSLKSECNPRQILEELRKKYSGAKSVLLVGHEPHLSGLTSLLISGREDCSVEMKKGGLCKLKVRSLDPARGSAVLKWLLTPKQLVLLAGVV